MSISTKDDSNRTYVFVLKFRTYAYVLCDICHRNRNLNLIMGLMKTRRHTSMVGCQSPCVGSVAQRETKRETVQHTNLIKPDSD